MDEDIRAIVPLENGEPSEGKDAEEPAVRSRDELAAEVAKILDLIAARLELETPHPSTAARVRGARTVPREFVLSMMAAVERRPDLPILGKFDTVQARGVLESADAYRLVAERTAMFLARLNYTIEARWAEVVSEAMHLFSMATVLAKDPERAELAAEVENLRRQLGRKGVRKKKKKTAKTGEPPE